MTNLRSRNRMRNRAPSVSIVPAGTDLSSVPFPGTSYRATIECPCRDGSSAHNVYPYANAHADCGTRNAVLAKRVIEAESRIENCSKLASSIRIFPCPVFCLPYSVHLLSAMRFAFRPSIRVRYSAFRNPRFAFLVCHLSFVICHTRFARTLAKARV
jgi:hypothetical protein